MALACILVLPGCGNPVIYRSYAVVLPDIPRDWEAVLGKPLWRIEWVDPKGNWRTIREQETRVFHLEICSSRVNPVIAYPHWPNRKITPGMFYPAGGLFPLDTQGDTLRLDWQGGVDARFFMLLSGLDGGGKRSPEILDWPRFRTLLREGPVSSGVKADPWIVDWELAAQKIVRSGFDKRYLVSRTFTDMKIPIPEGGTWISPSPFGESRYWETGETMGLKASESPARYYSENGVIVYTSKTWSYFPRE